MNQFYKGLTPYYHLIYQDWEKSIRKQAKDINSIIREKLGDGVHSILDVSCGIGTQAIGLAQHGYQVTASDLSPEEAERAKVETSKKGLNINFSVSDMRDSFKHHAKQFDAVISCDNSVPHLLTDDDILLAFSQFHQCTRPGGTCIISVRDYEKEDLSKQQIKPYGVREEHGVRWLLWQVWDPHGSTYDVTMYLLEERAGSECRIHIVRTVYYAIGIQKLMDLMRSAGFENVTRRDGVFFQPLITGTRKVNIH
ncbi:MAG: Tellurite resistance protein TehB [Lentisphaerae bacterium GWF2_49_21]|nr:MAG: Tellurite resistance protein TehB [Lentisphaerae bacterium GWF2_49_21]